MLHYEPFDCPLCGGAVYVEGQRVHDDCAERAESEVDFYMAERDRKREQARGLSADVNLKPGELPF